MSTAARALPTEAGKMNLLEGLDTRINPAEEERMLLDSVRSLARDRIAPRAEHSEELEP